MGMCVRLMMRWFGAGFIACGVSAPAFAGAPNVMLVVVNSASLDAQESARRTLLQGWGYTVTPISATATQAVFDAAMPTTSAVYIVETVASSDVSTKLTGATCGIVNEEAALSDEFGFAASMSTFTGNQIDVVSTSHYITQTLSAGTNTLFSAVQPVRYLSGAQGGYIPLAEQVGTGNVVMAVMERGAALSSGGTAAGRRVYLPWGNTGVDLAQINSTGQTIMKRSVEWVIQPISSWKLDDGSGTTVMDSTGGRNGTRNGPTWTTGKVSGALNFDGVDDYVSVANASAFQVTRAITIAGWVRATTWPSGTTVACLLRKGEDNPNNWELSVCNGKPEFLLEGYDDSGIKGTSVLPNNQWVHLAATWDGSTGKVYVNGVLNSSAARTASIGTDTRPVYLGGRVGATDVVPGKVDEVRFYNRALTAAEIAELAQVSPVLTRWQQTTP
jgi:hypothetical protein